MTNKFEATKQALQACKTMEELNEARKAIMAFHPDNNLDDVQTATDCFIALTAVYDMMGKKLQGYKPSKRIEEEVKRRNETLRIRRDIKSVSEFFGLDGAEQMSILKGQCGRVAIVLDNSVPTPNSGQITDKHRADRMGNLDGMRSYAFVQYCFNKSKTLNMERIEECAQTAWVKLAENATNEKYSALPFYSLLWISCRQAINNLYNAEVRNAQWLDREHDLYDLNAYETKAPADSHTEVNAVYAIWLDGMLGDDIDRDIYSYKKQGFTDEEIGNFLDMSKMAVSKRLQKIHDRMNKDRMLEALNTTADKAGCRKNASASEIVRALIMQAIRNGISYKRIAYYLHCEEIDIPKLLRK